MNTNKIYFFALLYFVQGTAIAYFAGFQKRYLSNFDVSPSLIAWVSGLVLLPFVIKPILGLICDSFSLSRKRVLIFGLVTSVASFGVAYFVDPSQIYFFSGVMIAASLGVAIFDTVADALAVDVFFESEFSTVQSIMIASKAIGLILFSVIFGYLIDQSGYKTVFLFLSLICVIPFFLISSVQDTPKKDLFQWSAFRSFKDPKVLRLSLYGVLYSIPSFGVLGLVSYYLAYLGWTASSIGSFEALKSAGSVMGAVVSVYVIKKYSFDKFAVVSTLLALVLACLVVVSKNSVFLGIMVLLIGLVWAFRESVYLTLSMKATNPLVAATMFSTLMAFSNLGTAVGEGFATAFANTLGFAWTFAILGLANVFGLFYFRIKKQVS